MRLLVAIVVAAFVLIAGPLAPLDAQQPLASTTISGADLPRTIRLAPVDHDAFVHRLDLPPLFEAEPVLSGPSYIVTSPYWDAGVRAGDVTQPLVDEEATYYPEGGYVRTRQGAKVVWTALDMSQKAILDRYIRYAPSLSADPSVFEVMRAAGLAGEAIGITAGPLQLTPDQRIAFWRQARDMTPRIVPTPTVQEREQRDFSTPTPAVTWLIFNLPEGRSVSMAYSNASGVISEVHEADQGKVFPVPRDWLVPVLGEQARFGPAGNPLAPLAVPQQSGDGSPIWWLIMIGGGLGAIAAAILLQRRLSASHG